MEEDTNTPNRLEPATPNKGPLTYEEVLRHFDAYKAKTKDWQAKVRDRDSKMRAQLLESTTQIREKDEQIQTLSKTVGELEKLRHAAAAAKTRAEELEQAQAEMEKAHGAVSSIARELEHDVEAKQQEIYKLRHRIEQLEEQVANDAFTASGKSKWLDKSTLQVLPNVEVKCRLRVEGIEHLLCVANGNFVWVAREEFCASGGKGEDLPAFLETVHEQEIAQAFQRGKAVATAEASEVHSNYEKKIQELHNEKDVLRKEVKEAVEKAAQEKQHFEQRLVAQKNEFESQLKSLQAAHASEIEAITAQSRSLCEKEIAAVTAEAEQLREYRAKAQLAMKNLRMQNEELQKNVNHRTNSATEETSLLEKQLLEMRRECQLAHEKNVQLEMQETELRKQLVQKQKELEDKVRVGAEREAKHLEKILQLDDKKAFLEEQIQKLNDREREMGLRSAERVKEKTYSAKGSQTNPEESTEKMVHDNSSGVGSSFADPPVVCPSVTTKERGTPSELDFGAVLEAADSAPHTAPTRSRERVADKLRGELRQALGEVAMLRSELRDLALSEQRHFEQERVLKEQLREEERKNTRDALRTEQADYIKNVVVKFCTSKVPEIQRSLVPVLGQLLQLSKQEVEQMEAAVK